MMTEVDAASVEIACVISSIGLNIRSYDLVHEVQLLHCQLWDSRLSSVGSNAQLWSTACIKWSSTWLVHLVTNEAEGD